MRGFLLSIYIFYVYSQQHTTAAACDNCADVDPHRIQPNFVSSKEKREIFPHTDAYVHITYFVVVTVKSLCCELNRKRAELSNVEL